MELLMGSIVIEEEKIGDIQVFRFKGKLDALSSPSAEKKIFDSINEGEHQLIFDFSYVDYLSSAGMRMLLSTTKRLKSLSGKVVLACIDPVVMEVLTTSGLDRVLLLEENVQKALKSFSQHTVS